MLRVWILLIFACLSFYSLADNTKVNNTGDNSTKVMTISTLPDNPLISWVKGIVHKAYADIGYKVKFIELPAMRGLSEAKQGNVDALLVRAVLIEKQLPDYVRVPVIIGQGQIVLYCQQSVECSEAVLDDKNNLVGTIIGTGASSQYMEHKNASTYEVPRDTQISKMFEASRLDYILSIDIERYGNYSQIDSSQYQRVILASFDAYHYLHKNQTEILPQLTQSMLAARTKADQKFPSLEH